MVTGNIQPATTSVVASSVYGTLSPTHYVGLINSSNAQGHAVATGTAATRRIFHDAWPRRAPISVGQHQGFKYPMLLPSSDIKHLLADFYFQYRFDGDVVEPISLAWLYGLGDGNDPKPAWAPDPVHAVDLVLRDAAGTWLFDSTQGAYLKRVWTRHLAIHQWITDEAICRMVVHTPDALSPLSIIAQYFFADYWAMKYWDYYEHYDQHIVPEDGRLDPRTTIRTTKYVRSLVVNGERLAGKITLNPGYNIGLHDSASLADVRVSSGAISRVIQEAMPGTGFGIRKQSRLHISAAPGDGLGRAPSVEDATPAILKINNQGPDKYGNFSITATGCYSVAQPTVVVVEAEPRLVTFSPASLYVAADCPPCCDCPEFVEVKLAIDSSWENWKDLAERSEGVRDEYSDLIDRWNEQKECRESQPQRLMLITQGDGNLAVIYTYCHMEQDCEGPLNVMLTFRRYRPDEDGIQEQMALGAELVKERTTKNEGSRNPHMRPYVPNGTLPVITASWESIDNRRTAKLYVALSVDDVKDGDCITVTATPTFMGTEGDTLNGTLSLTSVAEITIVCPSDAPEDPVEPIDPEDPEDPETYDWWCISNVYDVDCEEAGSDRTCALLQESSFEPCLYDEFGNPSALCYDGLAICSGPYDTEEECQQACIVSGACCIEDGEGWLCYDTHTEASCKDFAAYMGNADWIWHVNTLCSEDPC